MNLHELKPAEGSTSARKRVGRGSGSGIGKTAGYGHKGQKARSGYSRRPGFEGGQMPLQRRLPKFGFTNKERVEYKPTNLSVLEDLAAKKNIAEISVDTLIEAGLVSKGNLVKILGNGKLTKKVVVKADKFSKSAVEKIEAAGGKAVLNSAAE